MKLKFKINEDTTLEDAEEALKTLYDWTAPELDFNDILRVANFLGCELQKSPRGSAERFSHELISTYLSIHVIHKGKAKKQVLRRNFRAYLYPHLVEIIRQKKDIEKNSKQHNARRR